MATGTSRWYWVCDDRTVGPITWGDLLALARSGQLRPDDPVLREGSQTWQPAQTARDVQDATSEPDLASRATLPMIPSMIDRPSMGIAVDSEDGITDRTVGNAINGGRLLWGILLCGGAILGTIWGYNAAVARGGGQYIIFTGPILCGLTLIVRSFGGSQRAH